MAIRIGCETFDPIERTALIPRLVHRFADEPERAQNERSSTSIFTTTATAMAT
jgi:hypothetical protein